MAAGDVTRSKTWTTIKDGIWRDHPIFSMLLGICSALAVSNRVGYEYDSNDALQATAADETRFSTAVVALKRVCASQLELTLRDRSEACWSPRKNNTPCARYLNWPSGH